MVATKPVAVAFNNDRDSFVYLHDVRWVDFERFITMRGERGPRIAYLDGELELMSPSSYHAWFQEALSSLLRYYAIDEDLPVFEGLPQWLVKRKREKVGVEPDLAYMLTDPDRRDRPDIVIEVVWTSGGIDKLEIYHRLTVPEVWFWEDGKIDIYRRTARRYVKIRRSDFLPELDIALIERCLQAPTHQQVLKRFIAARKRRSRKRQ
jgi:Uma2 family endonuclease